jgi:hypothetical protein
MFPDMDIENFLNVRDFGGLGNGQTHPLRWSFSTLAEAQAVYPHALSLDDEQDWAAFQKACNQAGEYVQSTLARGSAPAIHRTGTSFAPPVFLPPGRWMINRPVEVYPHTSIFGAGWGVSQLQWTSNLPDTKLMACNPQGLMWLGPTRRSCLLWLLGDEEWPVGSGQKVAGMVNTIRDIGFKCHDGPGIFIGSNQNQLTIRDCHFNGWGDGPTGLGIVANNSVGGTQITNLIVTDNMFEGCKAMIIDRVWDGHFAGNQVSSCTDGLYVGSFDSIHVSTNLFTNPMEIKPLRNAIWLGSGLDASVCSNILSKIETHEPQPWGTQAAIKLGPCVDATIALNQIRIKNGSQFKHSGFAIHLVGPSQQFGGSMDNIKGQHGVHLIYGNKIRCDTWPSSSCKPIFIDARPGETIPAILESNVETQFV